MKNIDNLIQKAVELQSNGLVTKQIADELNVSKDTVTWLLTRARKEETTSAPKDISVNWSSIGKNALRLRYIASALCDMVSEAMEQNDTWADVIVGIGLSGIPLASFMAEELNLELSVYHSYEQNEHSAVKGSFSRNFSNVRDKKCIVVDDVITSGTTVSDVVALLRASGAKPVSIAVLVDKSGSEVIADVPVSSLMRIVHVG